MTANELDKEYYVMDVDGEDNHPLLSWADVNDSLFMSGMPIGEFRLKEIGTLNARFDEPYPSKYEIPDWMMLGNTFACSFLLKSLFERNRIYGIEFLPMVSIIDNHGRKIKGYYVVHIWNRLPAIDNKNYKGGKPNQDGVIFDLESFSLDVQYLKSIPLENRLIFELRDSPGIFIIHQKLYNIIIKAKPSGLTFFRVDDWNNRLFYR
ncbi:hypothetical protein [Dysgonomonas sp. 25]|uniref:imm11 family protein n=1 Tax=Dysgonomonas sp. 25 TaxID=2302933 RepID=UPI0013D6B90E|nr:hypothetical protein [Dysgonomonas sp. 25]NDV68958.1 hypothetical protein [Dysgonomonas sp. 25]